LSISRRTLLAISSMPGDALTFTVRDMSTAVGDGPGAAGGYVERKGTDDQRGYCAPSRTRTDTVRILKTAVWLPVTSGNR
jgi:hypothetical protein